MNEWTNALDAGAACIALRRNPHPEEQDLNVPRCLFDGSGIDAFQKLSFDERVDFLAKSLLDQASGAHAIPLEKRPGLSGAHPSPSDLHGRRT